MADLKLKFKMPDDESLANYISIKGEKGEPGDPTKTSQLENDSDFTTNAALAAGLATKANLTDYQNTAAQVTENTTAIEAIKNRVIRFSTNTASGTYYYPLALFQDISAGSVTNVSVNIHGRIGGSGTSTSEHIDITIVGYNGAVKAFGDYFTNNTPSDRRIDFVLYNDNGEYKLYIKTYKYTAVDLDVSFFHCTKIFDVSSAATTTPSGDLVWAFSQDSNVQVNYNGTINADISGDAATVNGHTVETDVPYGAVFTDTVYDDTQIQNDIAEKADSTEVADTYATKTELSTNISNLDTRVSSLASGSPLVASSISGMTDTTRVYVNTTDGYWYYYNGSAWVSGGVYQSAVTDTNATLAQINDTLYEKLDLTGALWINGGVNNGTHKISTGDTDRIRHRTLIHAKKGSYLTLSDTTNYRWKISKYARVPKNYLSYIGDVGSSSGLNKEPTKVLDEDCFIVITIASNSSSIPIVDDGTNFASVVSLLSGKIYLVDDTEPLDTELYVASEATTGAYWSSGYSAFNEGTSSSGLNAASRQYRVKAGQVIKLINRGNRTSTNVGHFMNGNQEYVSGWNVAGVQSLVVPDNAKYVVFDMYQANLNDYSFKLTYPKEPEEANYRLIYDDPKIKLIAHRGLNDFAPEATIPAYTLAGEAGMWGLKIDICETVDGYFVCSHDDSVDRMFDGTGLIRELTLADIQAMTVDAGANISQYPNQKIVQLYEALDICKRYNMHPFIEFKRLLSPSSVARVIEVIRSYGLIENTVCQCSDGIKDYLYALREITDIIPISYWLNTMDIQGNIPRVRFLGNAWLSLNAFAGSEASQFEAYARTLRDMHLPIHAAVLNIGRINYAKKWIKEYGLDMLVTSGITYADLDY